MKYNLYLPLVFGLLMAVSCKQRSERISASFVPSASTTKSLNSEASPQPSSPSASAAAPVTGATPTVATPPAATPPAATPPAATPPAATPPAATPPATTPSAATPPASSTTINSDVTYFKFASTDTGACKEVKLYPKISEALATLRIAGLAQGKCPSTATVDGKTVKALKTSAYFDLGADDGRKISVTLYEAGVKDGAAYTRDAAKAALDAKSFEEIGSY